MEPDVHHRRVPIADANTYSHRNADSDSDANPNPDRDSNTNSNPHANSNSDSDTNGDACAHRDTNAGTRMRPGRGLNGGGWLLCDVE